MRRAIRRGAAERLDQVRDLVGRDHGPAVLDPEQRALALDAGAHAHPATAHVVADGVVEEVDHEPLDEPLVPARRRGLERRLDPGLGAEVRERGLHDRREVERPALLEPALAARERQQRLDHALLLGARREHALADRAQRAGVGVRVGERDLDHRALERQRRAELVRGVRDEPPLGLERGLQTREQAVDRVAELLQLVVRAGEREPLVEVLLRDLARRRGHRPQRAERAPGHQPAEQDRAERHDPQREHRHREQRAELLALGLVRDPLGEEDVGHVGARRDLQRLPRVVADPDRRLGAARGTVLEHRLHTRLAPRLPRGEPVGDRQQRCAGDEEQRSVEQRQAQAHGAPRQPAAGERAHQIR